MRLKSPSNTAAKDRGGKGGGVLRLWDDTRGVTMIEYALIFTLIAFTCVLLLQQIEGFVSSTLQTVANGL